MNLGELRTHFKNTLNRDDCDDLLADTFIQLGIKRVHRRLRVPALERSAEVTTDSQSRLLIPSDYLEMIALYEEDGDHQLVKKTKDEFLRYPNNSSVAVVYTRKGNYWHLKPTQEAGVTFNLDYYGEMLPLEDDEDTDPILDVAWDIILYGALSEAANYFEDDREGKWETQFLGKLQEVQDQSDEQDASEGIQTVSPGTSTEY